MDHFQRLLHTKLISAPLLSIIEAELREGGSLLTRLANHLGPETDATWHALAEQKERPFLKSPALAGPIDARLLNIHQALDHLVLPWRRRFTTIDLITPNPIALSADYHSLKPHLQQFIPGGQVSIQLAICTPGCFREIFALLYPNLREHQRTMHDHLALAALIPATQTTIKPTHEEQARALASYSDLNYLDPEAEPPSADLAKQLPLEAFISARLYPHSVTDRNEIVTLAAALGDRELKDIQRRAAHLEELLMQPIKITLTTHLKLLELLESAQEAE